MLEVVHPRWCGLDVHKATVVACLSVAGAGEPVTKEVRTFGTMTADLVALGDWLAAHEVTHVAMESTGVYWQPVWNVLVERFALLLVNAAHVKAIPRRKTDVRDAEWLADLLQHGLLRASFVPERAQQELRELTRQRASLRQDRATVVNRLHKALEGANLKLGSVLTDVTRVSGRAILEALVAGEDDPAALAALAVGQVRRKRAALEQALTGRIDAHLRLLVGQHLAHIAFLDAQLAAVDGAIAAHPATDAAAVVRLDTIPGVGRQTAEVILAEVGSDVSRFPSADHLTSWAGLCPGLDESAGKRRSGTTRKGNRALRTALVEAAKAAGRSKATALGRRYRRLQPRLGGKKATVAIARRILEAVYHILKEGTPYREPPAPGGGPLTQRLHQRQHVQALQELGFHVILQPLAA
jgi:transposase